MARAAFLVGLLALAASAAADEASSSCESAGSTRDGCEVEEASLLQRVASQGARTGLSATRARSPQPQMPDPARGGQGPPAVKCPAPLNPIPSFEVDLDAPASSRWAHVAESMKEGFEITEKSLEQLFEALASRARANGNDLDATIQKSESLAKELMAGTDYLEEMEGLASALGVGLGFIWRLSLVYTISGGCTSVVGSNVEDGTAVHGRLLDYQVHDLQHIQLQAKFTKAGETAYECITYLGFVGCLTGMVPGGFSISLNQKDMFLGEFEAVHNLIKSLKGAVAPALFIRNLLSERPSWSYEMLAEVASTPLARACYLTIAGTSADEGAVFARASEGVTETRWMNASIASEVQSLVPRIDLRVNQHFVGKPFVFITNDDWDVDMQRDASDKRGQCAWQKLNTYDTFDAATMWDALLNPCQLQTTTNLAVVMSPADGSVEAQSMCGEF